MRRSACSCGGRGALRGSAGSAGPPTCAGFRPCAKWSPAALAPLARSIELEVGPSLMERVIRDGVSSEYGVRPLRRVSPVGWGWCLCVLVRCVLVLEGETWDWCQC